MAVQRASEGEVRDDLVAEAMTPGGKAALKLEQFLPYQLNVVASLTSQALSRVYARRYSIGVPEWRVLVTLGQYGVMTAKAIGAHTHMHKTKVSRAVALLEKRRLLARRTNREDMREAFLSLTAAGRTMYEELAPHALDFARRLTEILTPAERDVFNRALRQLTARSAQLVAEVGQDARRGLTRRKREALFLLPLVGRLSGAHRAQSQGPRLRDRSRPPHQGRRPQQAPRIPRGESADARAGARCPDGRGADPVARHHRVSGRDPSRASALAQGPPRPRAGPRARANHRLRHPSAEQYHRRCVI